MMPDFILQIHISSQACAELRLHDANDGHLAWQQVDFQQLTDEQSDALFDLHNHLQRFADASQQQQEIAHLGALIATHILGQEIFGHLYRDQAPRTLKICLPIISDNAPRWVRRLASIPWEIARPVINQKSLLQYNRHILIEPGLSPNLAHTTRTLAQQDALHILFVFADAHNGLPLAMRQERRAILRLFQHKIYPTRKIVAHTLTHDVTRTQLQKQLGAQNGYHIVHWSGHSAHSALTLAKTGGGIDCLSGNDFMALFHEAGVALPRLVVLSACQAGSSLDWHDWQGFFSQPSPRSGDTAHQATSSPDHHNPVLALLDAGIPSVLAMRFGVSEEYGRELALGFYQSLLADNQPRSIAQALTQARRNLLPGLAVDKFAPSDHAAPVLYGRDQGDLASLPGRSPASSAHERRLTSLPDLKVCPEFVGRTRELMALATNWLAPQAIQCVAQLVGMRGIGKTALAAEALDLWEHRFSYVLSFQCFPHLLSLDTLFSEIHRHLAGEKGAYFTYLQDHPGKAIYRPPEANLLGREREQYLTRNLLRALKDDAILLLFDHFEPQLKPHASANAANAGKAYACRDPAWDTLLETLAKELPGTSSRLLITSRHPLASLSNLALTIPLAPLPVGEGKLYFRQNPQLQTLAHGSQIQGRMLVEHLLNVSRFHPWLMSQLSHLSASDGQEAQAAPLPQLVKQLAQNLSLDQLPAVFASERGGVRELRYLENAVAIVAKACGIADVNGSETDLAAQAEAQVARKAAEEREVAAKTSAQPSQSTNTSASNRDASAAQPKTNELASLLTQYQEGEKKRHASIQLPLAAQNGRAMVANMAELRVDLPLLSIYHPQSRHQPGHQSSHLPGNGSLHASAKGQALHDQFRASHADALAVDRAARAQELSRDCVIDKKLAAGQRLVVLGDPGCGKSTLLQWIAHHYSLSFSWSGACARIHGSELPFEPWLPLSILCRDLLNQPLPDALDALLRIQLGLRHFSIAASEQLTKAFEDLMQQGRMILLIDGLDEIPDANKRLAFCKLLNAIAQRFPKTPMVITSRMVGFQVIQDQLLQYEHLLVSPLDQVAKKSFIQRWANFINLRPRDTRDLIEQVCHNRTSAKLTETMLLLALTVQIQILDQHLPERRIDLLKRATQLMIEQRKNNVEPELSFNELLPHLEYLAYWMRSKSVQKCSEVDVINVFAELRKQEPNQGQLCVRKPQDLLQACIEVVGILNVAGIESDKKGLEWPVVQFFHQSFQEYFAAQATNHGYASEKTVNAVMRVRQLLDKIKIHERQVIVFNRSIGNELVMAEQWQESTRMAIAGLAPDDADQAMLMLLQKSPHPSARPYVIFALQCLVDGPQVKSSTIEAVFDAALSVLNEADGFTIQYNTRMDEVLATIAASPIWPRLHKKLVDGFIQSRNEQRGHIGRCLFMHCSNAGAIALAQADALIASWVAQLASPNQAIRVDAAILVLNRCFASNGKLGFLTPLQQKTLGQALLDALHGDEATSTAALWALVWFMGARNRTLSNKKTEPQPHSNMLTLNPSASSQIANLLQDTRLDFLALTQACVLLCCEHGLNLTIHQTDWIYKLATIADGNMPRYDLPAPVISGWKGQGEHLVALLRRNPPLIYAGQIAAAMGALSIFYPEMIKPLQARFLDSKISTDDRDEAMLYLAMMARMGNFPAITQTLVSAADTAPPNKTQDYLYSRGLFGLLLVGDIQILAQQILKALPHNNLAEYAYGIAGSGDPNAELVLRQLAQSPNQRIHTAANAAMQKKWHRQASPNSDKTGLWESIKKNFF